MKLIPYSVEIKPADNAGYIVKVGCQTLVYTDVSELVGHLEEYLTDPEGTIKTHEEERKEMRAETPACGSSGYGKYDRLFQALSLTGTNPA